MLRFSINVQCQEISILPPMEGTGIPWGVVGSGRPENLKKCMKLNWNFQRGGLQKNPFHGGGMDNFWNYAIWLLNFKILNLTEKLRNKFPLWALWPTTEIFDNANSKTQSAEFQQFSLLIIKPQTINQTVGSFSTHSVGNHMAMNMIINGKAQTLSPIFPVGEDSYNTGCIFPKLRYT